jgi:hypothetical protein
MNFDLHHDEQRCTMTSTPSGTAGHEHFGMGERSGFLVVCQGLFLILHCIACMVGKAS